MGTSLGFLLVLCCFLLSLHNRQTNAQQGGRGRANHTAAAPPAAFSFVPSTARFLFGGSKRKCGVGTVGSENRHLLTDCGYFGSLNARFSRHGYLLYALRTALGPCGSGTFQRWKVPKDTAGGVFRIPPPAPPHTDSSGAGGLVTRCISESTASVGRPYGRAMPIPTTTSL